MSLTDEVLDPNVRYITNSEIQSFKQCKRQWWMEYVLRLRKRRNDGMGKAAQTGNLVHGALESYYRDPNRDASRVIQEFRRQRTEDPEGDTYADEYAMADAMIEGYFEWLAKTGADQELEIAAVESKITTEAPGDYRALTEQPVRLLGKLDLIARKQGQLYTVDHKTVQTFDAQLSVLPMNEQSRHYAVIQQRERPQELLQGSIWNMLRKVKRTGRAKPPFYMRHDIRWSGPQLKLFWDRLGGEITDMLQTEAKLRSGLDPQVVAYPSPSGECSWRCEFYPVCSHMDDPRTDSPMLIDAMYEASDPLERYKEKIPE